MRARSSFCGKQREAWSLGIMPSRRGSGALLRIILIVSLTNPVERMARRASFFKGWRNITFVLQFHGKGSDKHNMSE